MATDSIIDPSDLFDAKWKEETTEICEIVTFREENGPINSNILKVKNAVYKRAMEFNLTQDTLKFSTFEWCADKTEVMGNIILTNENYSPSPNEGPDHDYWVFGLRFGGESAIARGETPQRYSMICHLDTVPAQDSETWKPFEVYTELKNYPDGFHKNQKFLVGRGCIDDKGPAMSAFVVARALAKAYDSTKTLDNTQVEIIFDTSEETDMSTPQYLASNENNCPDFGIVYDAMWTVRAEKGCERPVFTIAPTAATGAGLYIESLNTADYNSTNTIPDYAVAVIKGDSAALDAFAESVDDAYDNFDFDAKPGETYNPARMEVSRKSDHVELKTFVAGAQHGSAPDENLKFGANPLVSLSIFLGALTENGSLAINAPSGMCQFIRWAWGFRVFGEDHPALLQRQDDIFTIGTTYGVTKFKTLEDGSVTLEIDIRFALGHWSNGWEEGDPEGLVDGESLFPEIFARLLRKYNYRSEYSNYPDVTCTPNTAFGPDVRDPNNHNFQAVKQAYTDMVGGETPMLAIGGGTDAKGFTFLMGAGPLFGVGMGDPINYHGLVEGAPIRDMKESTKILCRIMQLEIEDQEGLRMKAKEAKRIRSGGGNIMEFLKLRNAIGGSPRDLMEVKSEVSEEEQRKRGIEKMKKLVRTTCPFACGH